jgi:coproporphyrinogen III oxidase-like Fe-S oxidoreductase
MENTIRKTLELKPDRLAFYSYARSMDKRCRAEGFDENDLLPVMRNADYMKKVKVYWKNWVISK